MSSPLVDVALAGKRVPAATIVRDAGHRDLYASEHRRHLDDSPRVNRRRGTHAAASIRRVVSHPGAAAISQGNAHRPGHTDRIGSRAYNMKLSTHRAETVRSYLMETAGIPAGKITARGVDGSDPATRPGEC